MAVSLSHLMSEHHKLCDDLFASIESAVAAGDWPTAKAGAERLVAAVEWHFDAEERLLFPPLEDATGGGGPPAVMRFEHQQLRELLAEWARAVATQDRAAFGEHSEGLLILLQQHNAKEENILYPMCEQFLGPRADAVAAELEAEISQPCPS